MWGAPRRIPTWRLLPQKVEWIISSTAHFFDYKKRARKSSPMSQGGTDFSFFVCFSLQFSSLAVCYMSLPSCIAQGSLITTLREKDGLRNSYFNLFDPSGEARSRMTPCKIDLLHPFRAYSWKFTAQVQGLYSGGNKLIYSHADQFRTWWRLGERITCRLLLKATL